MAAPKLELKDITYRFALDGVEYHCTFRPVQGGAARTYSAIVWVDPPGPLQNGWQYNWDVIGRGGPTITMARHLITTAIKWRAEDTAEKEKQNA